MNKIETFQYDCILLDIMLPDGNGLKILEELKKQHKQDGVITKNALDNKIEGLKVGQMIILPNLYIFKDQIRKPKY